MQSWTTSLLSSCHVQRRHLKKVGGTQRSHCIRRCSGPGLKAVVFKIKFYPALDCGTARSSNLCAADSGTA